MLLDITSIRTRAVAAAGYIGAVEFYRIEFAPLEDGNWFVSASCRGHHQSNRILARCSAHRLEFVMMS